MSRSLRDAGPALFAANPPSGYAQGFPHVYDEEDTNHLPTIYEGNLFPTSPAFNPEFMDE